MSPETEIRHLRPCDRRYISEMLDAGDHWRSLASILPKPDCQEGYLLTGKSIQLLEQQKTIVNGSPTRALLDYWGTMGRKRPTLQDLLHYLICSKLYQAADYIAVNLLNGQPVSRDKSEDTIVDPLWTNFDQKLNHQIKEEVVADHLPAKVIDDENHEQSTNEPSAPDFSSLSLDDNALNEQVISMLGRDSDIKRFDFDQLASSTRKFSSIPLQKGGCKLGEGAFGAVYLAKDSSGQEVAVKLLKDEYGQQFIRELDVLTRFNHDNLLNLLGIACEASNLCLVYEYMCNGSLADRLICLNGTQAILWKQRLNIAIGTARGINHLHENSFIHRDIKSANILLDKDFTPKVGDFGLARLTFPGKSTQNASTIMGTSIYMAPEAFRGNISVKMDIYSFGIVLLELLTGQPPFDENREGGDILSWSQEVIIGDDDDDDDGELDANKLKPYLDEKAGDWNLDVALKMMVISRKATEYDKKDRPIISEVLRLLEII